MKLSRTVSYALQATLQLAEADSDHPFLAVGWPRKARCRKDSYSKSSGILWRTESWNRLAE